MSTTTEAPETPTRSKNFKWDGSTCTNPEKVTIRCNAVGAACMLLVASDEETWFAGFQCGGRNVAYTTVNPHKFSTQPRATREGALIVARDGVAAYLAGINEPSAVAIRAGLAKHFKVPVESLTREPDPGVSIRPHGAEPLPQAFDGRESGVMVDFPTREDAEEELKTQRSRPGFADYTTEIRKTGKTHRLSYARVGAPAPADPEADEIQPAPNMHGFQFDASGFCANPESISVPMSPGLEGITCNLLIAQRSELRWFAGYKVEGAGLTGLIKMVQDDGVEYQCTRTAAIATAQTDLLKALGDGLPGISDAIREFATRNMREQIAAQTNPATEPNSEARAPGEGHLWRAALGTEYENEVFTAGPYERGEDGVDRIRCKRVSDGKEVLFLPLQLFPVIPEKSEAAPTPTAAAPATVLPGLAHKVNEHGVFADWETVKIPTPKKVKCEVQLACDESGNWAHGHSLQFPTRGASSPAFAREAVHPTRSAALAAAVEYMRAGLVNTKHHDSAAAKKLSDQTVEALVAFQQTLARADATATEDTAAAQPPPRPTYRTEFAEIAVSDIQDNPANHRKHFNAAKDREMADSLLAEGLHQPIAVRKLLEGETPEGEFPLGDASAPKYELIFGHRRKRGAILAGIKTLQSKIYFDLTRKQATAIALIENLQRVDINAMEEAEGYAQLMTDENLTQDACAARIGRARSTVANALRLLRHPPTVRELIRSGVLGAEHGKGLARFVPDAKNAERWKTEFPKWELVVGMMAEGVVAQKIPSSALENGIPCIHALVSAGVAVRIDQFGEHRLDASQRKHAAYFPVGDGDYLCFNPEHWQAEVKARVKAQQERDEAEAKRRADEAAKLAKGGRKQLRIEDLDSTQYREFKGADEALNELVPEGKKMAAKGAAGRTTVVTDVQLADRLQKAMLKEIQRNREEARADLEKKVEKKIAGLKKVGPREFAWLVFLIVDPTSRSTLPGLYAEMRTPAGVKAAQVPAAAMGASNFANDTERREYQTRRLAALGKSEPVAVLKMLMTDYLGSAIADTVANGPESQGALILKWWLDTDTLWLLEETAAGRAELVERVKASPAVAKAIAGSGEEEKA